MPKSILKIDKFEGGINSNSDPKDLENNQIAEAQDAYLGKTGQIGTIGLAKITDDIRPLSVTITPGYGLGYFNTGHSATELSSGTYWTGDIGGYNDGTPGVKPFFIIEPTDKDGGFKSVYNGQGHGNQDLADYASHQPKTMCEEFGFRVHMGGTVGTPDVSWPVSTDDGSATVDGDSLSYRIIDDGTNKWFGMFPQNVLYNHTDHSGVSYTVDADYWFSPPVDTDDSIDIGSFDWNNYIGSGDPLLGASINGVASGYGANAYSNLLKAMAGMMAKESNTTVDLLGPKDGWTGLKVNISFNQYNDYTPSNKYIWLEFRHYHHQFFALVQLPFPGAIQPYLYNNFRGDVGDTSILHNLDGNFLSIPLVFDDGNGWVAGGSAQPATYEVHSAFNDASKQIQTTFDTNAPVTNLLSEGYYNDSGGTVSTTVPRLTRRLLPGIDADPNTYKLSLINTAGTDATVSGETYSLKITGANTPSTGTTVSQAYHGTDFDTFTEVMTELAADITPNYGSDKVTNGAFGADTDWTKGTGWAISGGVATCSSGTDGVLYNSTALTSGLSTDTYYKVQFDVTTYTSGTLYVDLGDTNGTNKQSTDIAAANQVFIIKTPGTLAGSNVRFYGGTFRGSIDNVTVMEITAGIGGLTASSSGAELTISTVGTGQHTAYSFQPSITRASSTYSFKNAVTELIPLIDSNSDLYIYDMENKVWTPDFNDTSASTTKLYWADIGAKPQFYSDEGILRFSDTDFSHTNNNPAWMGHINKNDLFNQTGSGTTSHDIKGWFVKDQNKGFPSDPNDWLIGTDWSDSTAASPSSKLDIKIVASGTDAARLWTAGNYKFYLTAVYDDDFETLPTVDTAYLNYHDGSDYIFNLSEATKGVTFECTIDPVGASFDERLKAFRFYFSKEVEGYGIHYELGTLDFKEGFIRADGIGTESWVTSGSGSNSDAKIASFTMDKEYLGTTYEMNTGYSPMNRLTHVDWKTATIIKNRCWVANVQYKNKSGVLEHYPHKLFASPVGKLDTFLVPDGEMSFGRLEGDEIIKLESFSDRVLIFSETTLLIVNVSTLNDEFLEGTYKWKGVSSPNHVINTSRGIIWANEYSVFKYDGEDVIDLMQIESGDFEGNRNINRDDWSSFFSSSSLVAFEPLNNQVIIKRSNIGSSAQNNGDVYIFDLDTESWATGLSRFVTTSSTLSPKDTNIITTKNGSIYMITGKSTEFNSKLNYGDIDEGGEPPL